MRFVSLLLSAIIISQTFLAAEEAGDVRERGIAALKDSQTNPRATVDAARFFAKAAALYNDAGDEEKNVEMNSFLYWCKKKMTLEDIEAFTKGDPTAAGKLAALDKKLPQADEAQKWFDRAEQFARKNPDQHLLIAIRFYEVADRFKGSDAGLASLDRSLKEQMLDKASAIKTPSTPAKPVESAAKDIGKCSVPPADELKTAENLIKDLLKADYAKTDAAGHLALSATLLQRAGENKNDTAAYYVLLHDARDMAVLGGDSAKASEVQCQLRDAFKQDFPRVFADLQKLEASAKNPEQSAALAILFSMSANDALAVENYDQAVRFNSRADNLLPVIRDPELKARLKTEISRAQMLKRENAAALAAQKTLAAKPDDPDASLVAGKFALLVGDTEKSMTLLARSKDGVLGALAKRELALPREPAEQAQLGDGWFDRAEKEGSIYLKGRMQERAAHWYTLAAPGLSGLMKLKIEGRIKSLAQIDINPPGAAKPNGHAYLPVPGMKPEAVLDLGGGVKMEFVYVPAGTFEMGSPKGEQERQSDEIQHTVTISKAFYMAKCEVTQDQYLAVTGENPSRDSAARIPVEQISWDDAVKFCEKLSATSAKIVRLPTEAEWEYACRAGTRTAFNTGDTEAELEKGAWYNVPFGMVAPHTVGDKGPNAWGLYDMHGNVWEWCHDFYAEYKSGAQTDPRGPATGTLGRVTRGGSINNTFGACRSANRAHYNQGDKTWNIGFRPVMELTAAPKPVKPMVQAQDNNAVLAGRLTTDKTYGPGAVKAAGTVTFEPAENQTATATFAPGTTVNNGDFNMSRSGRIVAVGSDEQPIVFKGVKFGQDLGGRMVAKGVLFDGCRFGKTGPWFAYWSTQWRFHGCVFYKCEFPVLHGVDYGVCFHNCVFSNMTLPDLKHRANDDVSDRFRGEWNQFGGCTFLDCQVSPTVFWCSEQSNFVSCKMLAGPPMLTTQEWSVEAFMVNCTGKIPLDTKAGSVTLHRSKTPYPSPIVPPSNLPELADVYRTLAEMGRGYACISKAATYKPSSIDNSYRPSPKLLNGERGNMFDWTDISFQTNVEQDPYIVVDLGTKRAIAAVDIVDCSTRARGMTLWIGSDEKGPWTECWTSEEPNRTHFTALFEKPVSGQFLKVGLRGNDRFHLSELRVFEKK